MIFITVGSSEEYKFPRLLQIVDELCDEGVINGKDVVAQIGYTEYEPRNYKAFDMTSDEEFKDLVAKADIIITHAGTGSVTSALKAHRKVIIFPRQYRFGVIDWLEKHGDASGYVAYGLVVVGGIILSVVYGKLSGAIVQKMNLKS